MQVHQNRLGDFAKRRSGGATLLRLYQLFSSFKDLRNRFPLLDRGDADAERHEQSTESKDTIAMAIVGQIRPALPLCSSFLATGCETMTT
jgi:hypothetical protein